MLFYRTSVILGFLFVWLGFFLEVEVVSSELGWNIKLSLQPMFSLAVPGTFRVLSEMDKKQFC